EWIIDTGGLDRGRWVAMTIGNQSGVAPFATSNTNVIQCVSQNSAGVIYIDRSNGNLNFQPQTIGNAFASSGTSAILCNNLRDSYPSGSNRIIPLATTGAVKF
ncbi:hypothetical protein CCY99_09280, partial [Helicobacter sp. 16-1353]|uniref:hypothetical protein n=1 Tax=Helicobacter sp. 16-1353 TaxID=2004996 RepID=UPI000DCD953C